MKCRKRFLVLACVGLGLFIVTILYAPFINGVFWGVVEGVAGRVIDHPQDGDCRVINTNRILAEREGYLVIGLVSKAEGLHLWGVSKNGKVIDLTCPYCPRLRVFAYLEVEDGKITNVTNVDIKNAEDKRILANNVSYVKSYIFARQLRKSIIRKRNSIARLYEYK